MADSGAEEKMLEFTPPWMVALVCFSIVLISLAVDRFLLCVGQILKKSRWEPLFGALRKMKEELMLLGFMSLLLPVLQTSIGKICISERLANVWLPCKKLDSSSTTARFTNFFWSGEARGRRLLAEAAASTDFCGEKGKVPLLSAEVLHDLDIFIFVLATFQCVCKIMLGYWKLLLVAGTILEHMITRLAEDVAKKHPENATRPYCNMGDKGMFVEFQSHYFWFRNSQFVPNLIHFVLFGNSLELSFFFFILFQYDFHSCIMGKVGFVVPRIAIGVFVQVMCIYRTLPLYAIVKSQIPALKEKQSDKQNKSYLALERIEKHLKENQSEECKEERLADLDEIKIGLKENEMHEEEEMWIVTKISKWIDKRKNSEKVAAKNGLTQTGSREGSVGVETTESDDRNSRGDIEA
ncbi:hypothetical protein NL676_019100 [Syzygium grande]|nr:hypothetical protein NL676_019100 [Syzygium grande]